MEYPASGALSREKFLHKKPPMVKSTTRKKVGNPSKTVAGSYVNQIEYPQFTEAVDNTCGKTCGECGKLRVINRYFASLRFPPSLWKTGIPVCIILRRDAERLCHAALGRKVFPEERKRKSLQIVKNRCQILLPALAPPDFFVKNRQKIFWYHLTAPGNTFGKRSGPAGAVW